MLWLLAESTFFFGFEHPVGGIVSILGAFLLGIGWVGKKRLERWDNATGKFVDELVARTKMLRRRSMQFIKSGLKVAHALPIIWGVVVGLFAFVPLFGIGVLFGLLSAIAEPLVTLLSFLVSALFQMCMAPYLLTRWLDKEGALERTFLLIGTVMGAVGIAMCLWKGP
jgi:hypothetical protein